MQHAPLDNECALFEKMSSTERLHYAVTRMIECEEVWSLGGENGWQVRESGDSRVLSIWPYFQLALEHRPEVQRSFSPQATSIEHFIYDMLQGFVEADIYLEIFPYKESQGHILSAEECFVLFEGILDSGAYFIEG